MAFRAASLCHVPFRRLCRRPGAFWPDHGSRLLAGLPLLRRASHCLPTRSGSGGVGRSSYVPRAPAGFHAVLVLPFLFCAGVSPPHERLAPPARPSAADHSVGQSARGIPPWADSDSSLSDGLCARRADRRERATETLYARDSSRGGGACLSSCGAAESQWFAALHVSIRNLALSRHAGPHNGVAAAQPAAAPFLSLFPVGRPDGSGVGAASKNAATR